MISKENGEIVASKVKVAKSFEDRLIGLMFKSPLVEFDSLLILKCNSIHTCFMKYPLDIIFLDKDYKIKKIYRNLKPWRMTRLVLGACQVLEMEAGKLPANLSIGEKLIYV